jgi:hypothetical protein
MKVRPISFISKSLSDIGFFGTTFVFRFASRRPRLFIRLGLSQWMARGRQRAANGIDDRFFSLPSA